MEQQLKITKDLWYYDEYSVDNPEQSRNANTEPCKGTLVDNKDKANLHKEEDMTSET